MSPGYVVTLPPSLQNTSLIALSLTSLPEPLRGKTVHRLVMRPATEAKILALRSCREAHWWGWKDYRWKPMLDYDDGHRVDTDRRRDCAGGESQMSLRDCQSSAGGQFWGNEYATSPVLGTIRSITPLSVGQDRCAQIEGFVVIGNHGRSRRLLFADDAVAGSGRRTNARPPSRCWVDHRKETLVGDRVWKVRAVAQELPTSPNALPTTRSGIAIAIDARRPPGRPDIVGSTGPVRSPWPGRRPGRW